MLQYSTEPAFVGIGLGIKKDLAEKRVAHSNQVLLHTVSKKRLVANPLEIPLEKSLVPILSKVQARILRHACQII